MGAYTSTGVKIEIAAKHWSRVSQKTYQEDPVQEMSHMLKKIERKTDSFEKMLDLSQRIARHTSVYPSPLAIRSAAPSIAPQIPLEDRRQVLTSTIKAPDNVNRA